MATICTNNLTGNDTTGNGSPSLPYKTINKALSVAANNDLVKVAGGQFVQVTGTVTVTARATTMTTSVDMTGSISVDDIIAIDTSSVDGWNKEYTLFSVISITSSNITITGQPVSFPSGTYDIYRLNLYHYSTSLTTAQETITTFTATDVVVSGGWSADFNTQIGWTGVRKTGTAGGTFVIHNNIIKPNIVFDKFVISKTGFSSTTSNASIGIDNISFVFTNNTFGTSNYGVYNPTGREATLISNTSQLNSSWNGALNKPQTLLLNQYITSDLNSANGFVKVGFTINYGDAAGASVKTSNLYVRTAGSTAGLSAFGVIPNSNIGDVFIDNLYIYSNANTIIPIFTTYLLAGAWRYIGNINVSTDGTTAGISPTGNLNSVNFSNVAPLTLNRTSGTLDSLPWRLLGSNISEAVYFCDAALPALYGYDSEGQKVIPQDGIPKFADPTTYVSGSNSLRQKLITNSSATTGVNKYILGNIVKPNTTFTINIVMKASKTLTTTSTSFTLLYGSALSAVLTLASTPTVDGTWRTYSYTVNPSSYPNWNYGDDGLMTVFYTFPSTSVSITDNDYIWVDSITIS